ncbi:MAG: DUF1015 domain-containing protein [Acidobacteria bacterium]|nr:DUF1015 domain-containing protein [Acidobacteriota bacterium]
MTLIKPFRALRPAPDAARSVSSVPYDVITEDEVREFIQENPLSFLRITRADADCSEADNHLQKAEENLKELIESGVLSEEPEPAIYIYRLIAEGHSQTGVVACCSLDEYRQGLIKKHEHTRPEKVAERTRHMVCLRAQTGLIFLAYRGTDTINGLVAEAVSGEPIYDFTCTNGIRQTVWKTVRPSDFEDAFGDVPALYVADGHHRLESARLAADELAAANPEHDGTEDYNFVIAGMFPAEQLKILAYNRVVRDDSGRTDEEILALLSESFIISPAERAVPEEHGEIIMYMSGKWYDLRHNVNYFREPDPIERLDVTILQQYVLAPVFGIQDPRTDERIGFVGGIHGTDELVRRVDSGEARAAFSLFATTMDDLFAVSDMGETMPPKSTWFEPKLKDGLFIHRI